VRSRHGGEIDERDERIKGGQEDARVLRADLATGKDVQQLFLSQHARSERKRRRRNGEGASAQEANG
jgi:hypothetical protein